MELNENFAYNGTKQNFDRDSYATLAEMKAVKAKKMPSIFHATCAETGKLYIYNKTNTDDEILGKWREVSSSGSEGPNTVYVDYEYVEGEDEFPDYSYEKFNYRREHNLLNAVKNNQFTTGTILIYAKSQWDGYPEYYEVVTYSYADTGMDLMGTKTVLKPLINKDGRGTITVVHNPYADGDGYYIEDAAENEVGTSETLFNNNGPELEIYGFTQSHISSDQMFETIGNSYYARYTGDYGRGNEPFIPGNVESRADSATVYIENAPMFGTQKCKLFAINTVGEVYEGFFVTTRTEPTFTSEGLVWRKVESENASGSSDYLRIEDDSSAVYLISSNNKSEVSPDDIFDYTDLPFYILKDGFDSDIELKYVGDVGSAGHNGVVFASEPFLEDDSSKSASLRKLLMYTAELVTYRHAWYMINPEVKEIGSGSCECEEDTDTIGFSTWPEYTSPEANGIVLDGQGGANIDDSNISVDPDDIEEED